MAICRNIHIINHLPHVYELEDLIDFCGRYEHLYIFGHTEEQEWLLKFFDVCGIDVDGYVVTRVKNDEKGNRYCELPVLSLDEVLKLQKTGIILGIRDQLFGEIIPVLREKGFADYFQMTEHTRIGIIEQMLPRSQEEMTFEVSLTDHCNLSCQMCDHFAQLSEPWFVDADQFERDMRRMGELFDHRIGAVTLEGGEPALHPELLSFIRITRREFPDAQVIVLTNGTLLLQWEHSPHGNFWEVCRENRVDIKVTVYPIAIDYEQLQEKAVKYQVPIEMSSNIHAEELSRLVKISDKHPMDLKGSIPKYQCVHCLYFNKFNVVKDGRYYMCPIEAHINIFNHRFGENLSYAEGDWLDIYKVKDWHEFAEYSSNWIPFCRYCDQKHWRHHSEWKISSRMIEEYVDAE